MKKLSSSVPGARVRRKRYYELRRQGIEAQHAAYLVGVVEPSTRGMYERWFQALESGQLAEPEAIRESS